jgi:hypothetical protein
LDWFFPTLEKSLESKDYHYTVRLLVKPQYNHDIGRVRMVLTPRERELLTGMGNCYASCHEDFDETVRMVGDARGLTVDHVKKMLEDIREKSRGEADYQRLRGRLPKDFPL